MCSSSRTRQRSRNEMSLSDILPFGRPPSERWPYSLQARLESSSYAAVDARRAGTCSVKPLQARSKRNCKFKILQAKTYLLKFHNTTTDKMDLSWFVFPQFFQLGKAAVMMLLDGRNILEHGVYDYRNLTQWRSFNSVTLSSHEHKRLIMGNTTGKIAGAANQAAGKVKEGLGKATLETEELAQEAMAKAERVIGDASPAVKRTLNDHTISIVAAILILTVLIQVILVKSWT